MRFAGWRRWKAREGRRLPINAKLMHGPGEQLRQKISDTEDSLNSALAILVVIGPFLVAFWALSRIDLTRASLGPVGWVALAFWAVITAWQIRDIVGLGRKRRRLLEGLIAEQFTAQELNRLVGAGCTVFHDVPGDGFNIDHVVIGPQRSLLLRPSRGGSRSRIRKVATTRWDLTGRNFSFLITERWTPWIRRAAKRSGSPSTSAKQSRDPFW
jgi:hypothetical protein